VYDSVGKDTWEASLDCLQRRGLMVSFGNASGPVTGVNLGILNDCEISPYSVVEDAHLEAACTIGPFARLRPGAELLVGAHVGN
ncbi:hypothetical protein MJI69_31255, partial [Salmonella enterica subsp. enterica serovar Anatum]|nr:hypothetical protein [Salmonella enterica subsp. enterica serovar Anatum]